MKKLGFLLFITLFVLGCGACGKSSSTSESSTPTTPTGLELKRTSTSSLTYQWNQVKGVDGYAWKLLQGSSTVQSGTVSTRNVTVSNLDAGTTYKFAVCSYIGDNQSDYCSFVEGTTDSEGGDNPDTPDTPVTPSSDLSAYYSQFQIPSAEEDGVARAFPGAEGGGMYTTGGRGGTVYHVTNLNDSGEGSLRYAVQQKGARIIVFDVAGVIALKSKLEIKNGDLTIAGQTAPGDGICIKDYSTVIKEGADNIIIRFIRFRLGDDAKCEDDAFWGRRASNIIIDHCSMSWSTDECSSFYGNENMTMQWCIIAESLNNSIHNKGSHGYGAIWGGKNACFHHNMFACHNNRVPRLDHPEIYANPTNPDKRGNVDMRNCVNYNWGSGNGAYGGEGGWFNMVNNYYKPGPASKDKKYYLEADSYYSSSGTVYGYPQLYLSGNYNTSYGEYSSKYPDGVYWKDEGVTYNGTTLSSSGCLQSQPFSIVGKDNTAAYTTTHSAEEAFSQVLAYAGASLARDAVDTRVTTDAKNGTASITDGGNGSTNGLIDTQSAVGGWPDYSATSEELANATDTDGDGIPDWFEDKFGMDKNNASDAAEYGFDANKRYTNLEMYLHYLVKDIVTGQISNGTYTKL